MIVSNPFRTPRACQPDGHPLIPGNPRIHGVWPSKGNPGPAQRTRRERFYE